MTAIAMIACLLPATRAHAEADDLRDLATRVEDAWRAAGGTVVRRDARFIMEDETATLDIRRPPFAPPDPCRRVAIIGARGMSFHVTAAAGASDDALPIASVAGVLELQGCGSVPDWVKLKSDSGRGALEIVLGSSFTLLPPASGVLLERTGGALPPAPEPGPLPPLASVAARASASRERLTRDGFDAASDLTWAAGEDGKGGGSFTLEEGCHRFGLFAVEPRARDHGRHAHLDLDGSLRREGRDVLCEDTSIAADVHLDACVAIPTKVTLSFEGAPRGSVVLGTHGHRALPAHLPLAWAPDMRARAAAALQEHQVASLPGDAVVLVRGPSGGTPIPFESEPGACYLAVAVLERGHGIALRASVGERVSQDERGSKEGGATVAFCVRDSKTARLDVDARSSSSGWGVALYRVVGGVWGEGP